MGGDEEHLQGLGPEQMSSARGRGSRLCRTRVHADIDGFPRGSLSVQIRACIKGTSCTSACWSSEFRFLVSSFLKKHQLNRF